MEHLSNNNELNSILKKLSVDLNDKNVLDLKNYVKKFPQDITGKYNYALVLEKTNNTNQAEIYYLEVINKKPNHWQSLTNLYLIYFHKRKYEKSLEIVNLVLVLKPRFQPSIRDKAYILFRLQKLEEALQFIIWSIKLNQSDYIALNIMGMIYADLKQNKLAIKIYKKAISINSKYYASYSNISKCLYDENKIDEAIKYLEECLKLNPNFVEAINNLANIYTKTGKHKEAIELYLKILNKNKDHPDFNLNIAIAYFFDKNYLEAEKYYKITEKFDSKSDKFKKNYSLFLLYKQKYKKAWELIDGRLKLQDFAIPGTWLNNFRSKIWTGQEINPSDSILIVKEQGVGDEILYSSMYSEALKFFSNCQIESDKRLLNIFKRSFNSTKIYEHGHISNNLERLKKIDKVIFGFDLPRIFRNSIEDFNLTKKYLSVDEISKENIGNKLVKLSNKKKIGIAWKSKREIIGKDKSINLDSFAPLLKLNKFFDFINLQYGDVENDINTLKKNHDLALTTMKNIDLFNDFEKISALLINLDLFITISNSTAHLAGALNVPTWLIKPKTNAIFHYWNQPNHQCPWYPSIRLIEQEDKEDDLIERLKDELIKYFN